MKVQVDPMHAAAAQIGAVWHVRRLRRHAILGLPISGILLSGCEASRVPTSPDAISAAYPGVMASAASAAGAAASGGGHFERVLFDEAARFQFAFTAAQRNPSEDAHGRFRFSSTVQGLAVTFHGRVTCLVTDPANRRAWIGGVITRNDSEHPNWTRDIHQPGRDSWFRVVDYGQGSAASQSDRSSIPFFEGTGGFLTAHDFCQSGFWPGGDVFTSPLLSGHVRVSG